MRPLKFYLKNPRLALGGLLQRVSFLFPNDKFYLKLLFYLEQGYKLDLDNPRTFSEKIQWLKLYNRKPEYTKMVDKYAVKEYVAGIIGEEYIIPTLGVWNSVDEIDFGKLPNQFVLKTTHDGGSIGVVICKDKSKFDISMAQKKIKKSLRRNSYMVSREYTYKNIPRRIIAEYFLDSDGQDLTDYKFYCFNGNVKYCQVIKDRSTIETIDFFDTKWNHQEFYGLNPMAKPANSPIAKPTNYEKMIEIANVLSNDIPFARIDLYNNNGKIYFGEITFYPAGGYGTFTPKEWNYKLGEMISLPNE